MDAINPAHGSVLRVNSPSLGIFSLPSRPPVSPLVPYVSRFGRRHVARREGDTRRTTRDPPPFTRRAWSGPSSLSPSSRPARVNGRLSLRSPLTSAVRHSRPHPTPTPRLRLPTRAEPSSLTPRSCRPSSLVPRPLRSAYGMERAQAGRFTRFPPFSPHPAPCSPMFPHLTPLHS